MSLPPPPLALAGYAPTQTAHRELDAIVAKYGQQCREAALEEAAQAQQVAALASYASMAPVEIFNAVRKIESIYKLIPHGDVIAFARAIEAAHGITPQGDKT